jgi:hypothetical protein
MAQQAKIRPIWSPWRQTSCTLMHRHVPDIIDDSLPVRPIQVVLFEKVYLEVIQRLKHDTCVDKYNAIKHYIANEIPPTHVRNQVQVLNT